jgi:hypothetical protein
MDYASETPINPEQFTGEFRTDTAGRFTDVYAMTKGGETLIGWVVRGLGGSDGYVFFAYCACDQGHADNCTSHFTLPHAVRRILARYGIKAG